MDALLGVTVKNEMIESVPQPSPFLKAKKIGFIGAGTMTNAVISSLVETQTIHPSKIFLTSRTSEKVDKLVDRWGITACASSDEVIELADIVFLAVKPQDLKALLETLGKGIEEHQMVISLAAGFDHRSLRALIPRAKTIVRVMPSTATKIQQGVVGYLFETEEAQSNHDALVREILSPIGLPVLAQSEELFNALMIACSSGIGFIFEFMQIWQEWLEEKGYSFEDSSRMVTETFVAAALLAKRSEEDFAMLQRQVTSKKGVTAEGLESFRSMDLDRTLRIGFENALLRNLQLARQS